jgi:hypothetical protein
MKETAHRWFVIASVFCAMAMFSSAALSAGSDRASDYRPTDSTSTEGVSLSWSAPITREDGDLLTLSELEGFRVYYGTDKNALNALVDLNDSSETSYTVTGLSPGVYYFAVTAYDYDGLESGYSEIVSKEVY